jgi:hypothetical protein
MRAAVLALGERMPASAASRRAKAAPAAQGDEGAVSGGAAPQSANEAADGPARTAHRSRRASARGGRRAKG